MFTNKITAGQIEYQRLDAEFYNPIKLKKLSWRSDWKEKKEILDDMCEFITDGTHITPNYKNEGFIFLSSKNINPYLVTLFLNCRAGDLHRMIKIFAPASKSFHLTSQNIQRRENKNISTTGQSIGNRTLYTHRVFFSIPSQPIPVLSFCQPVNHLLKKVTRVADDLRLLLLVQNDTEV